MRKHLNNKIEQHLTGLIRNGRLKDGDLLPSEPELSRKFKSSRMPVRQAVQNLVDHGVLVKVRGKGTYVRNSRNAPQLVTTNKIGVLFCYSQSDFFNSTFYTAILSGVQREALEAEKALVLHTMQDNDPAAVVRELLNDVDGFIFVDLLPAIAAKLEKVLLALPKPVVVLNYEHAGENIDAVVTDSRHNTRRLLEFLIGLGHRRIAYIGQCTAADHPNIAHRWQAYRETLLANGLAVDPGLMISGSDITLAMLDQLFGRPQPPTAVFCTGSHIVHQTLYPYFTQTSRRVPEDVSVVGYDDIRECELVRPRLTAIGPALPDMGRLGVKRLLERIAEQKSGVDRHYTITLPGTIIERESHRAIR
jgi:LacI family transcriptional regulator